MSVLKELDEVRIQKKRQEHAFSKNLCFFVYKENLWLFALERNRQLNKNQTYQQSVVLNVFTNTENRYDRFDSSNRQDWQDNHLLCEAVLIVFDFFYGVQNQENLNSHIALEQVGKHWKAVRWIIQADFQNCPGLFQNGKSLFQKRVQDVFFLRLLTLILNTKQTNTSNCVFHITMTRLRIALSNIYFLEFDTFFSWVQHEHKKVELQYIPFVFGSKNWTLKKKNLLKYYVTKVFYMRHAGSWMIGTSGPISFVKALILKVHQFLKERFFLKSALNLAQVTNIHAKCVFFVGYKIVPNRNCQLRFELPLERMLTSLALEGFCDTSGQPMPKKDWASEEDWLIVSTFNHVIFEIRSYWGPACNQNTLRRIEHMLYISCAKTVAHKHRTTASQIFVRYGKAIAINHPSVWETQIQINLEKIQKPSWVQTRRHLTQYDSFSNIV
nr:putative maturase [Klebsormidium flaccidum]WKT07018.1 putative maturase [Klebsormidium flaccidum]